METRTKPTFARGVVWALLVMALCACSVLNPGTVDLATEQAVVPATAGTTSAGTAAATDPASPTEHMDTPTPEGTTHVEVETGTGEGVLFQDDFSDTSSGWPASVAFDNYFIGYHEPTYYHVEVHASYDRAIVTVPKTAGSFTDFTMESAVFTEPNNTAPEGGFRYGLVFRRSGGQYYAFTISPRDQSWQFLKVSPSNTEELESGSNDSIQGLSAPDTLRVDGKGSEFDLSINDQYITTVSDEDYASGEVGFYVETLDIPRVHIHYDTLVVREVQLASESQGLLYAEDFTNTSSGWPASVAYDNYFIGYHEPTYYHVEVHAPYDRAVVVMPKSAAEEGYGDVTLESQVFTEPNNTAPEGGFRYGLLLRRSGGQYYAFTIAPREQSWQFLKVSPSSTEELSSGSAESIQGLTAPDTLRVDAEGGEFTLWINGEQVGEVSDGDYSSGSAGFYVETLDIPRVHIHYDTLTAREVGTEAAQDDTAHEDAGPVTCTIVAQVTDLLGSLGDEQPVIDAAQVDQTFEPAARSHDGQWLKVIVEGASQPLWVPNSTDFFSCEGSMEALPIEEP